MESLDDSKPPRRAPRDELALRTEEELLGLLGPVQADDSRHEPFWPNGRVAEVDLDNVAYTADRLRKQIQDAAGADSLKAWPADADGWLAFATKRPDLNGLPFRKGRDCRLDRTSAGILANISQEAQKGRFALQSRKVEDPDGLDIPEGADDFVVFKYVVRAASLRTDKTKMGRTVPGVVQILQVEGESVRLSLVEKFLARIDGPQATTALAQRALFDLSKDVRQAAIRVLKKRSREDYRDKLLAGLRYPWSPVGNHAASALVGVDDKEAALDLVELLDLPDPAEPFLNKQNKWAVRELVRINHLRNCMLCHAPSTDRRDLVRGVVPKYGEPLPTRAYYQSRSGVFVRADVTYLKQDFSLMHPVPNHGKWPRVQRFDYLVRERELTAEETAELVPESGVGVERSYPQREAALYALRKLTGLDGGRSAEQWRSLLGR